MKIQDVLIENGLNAAIEQYKLKVVRSQKNPNLILLKYNQIESPFAELVVQECRGLILDESLNWEVVSRSFDKFFNYGENYATKIEWKTAKVQEKLDGSLCVLYNYKGNWLVQTSGEPDAEGMVYGHDFTFATLFWKVFNQLNYKIPKTIVGQPTEEFCLSFELTTKYNKVVIRHAEDNLVLIGIRNKKTGQEFSVELLKENFKVVKSFSLSSFSEIIKTFKTIDPLKQEGYVVVDENFNRNKLKHPGYVAIHRLKDGFGPRRLVEILLAGESSEFITYFPEWEEDFKKVENLLNSLCSELEFTYNKIKDIKEQKAFAIEAMKTRCGHALFALRTGKVTSIKEFLSNIHIHTVMQLLGISKQKE